MRTSSLWIWSSAWRMAPSEPCTSALRMMRSSLVWPAWIWRYRSSSVARPPLWAGVRVARRSSIMVRAVFSSATTRRMSPAAGTSPRPSSTTADDGPALCDALALAVLQRPDAAVGVADDDDVADLERAGLDEEGRDGAAALVQLRLHDRADGRALGVGLELLDVGDDEDRVQQVVDAGAHPRADGDQRHVAAVLLDDHAVLGQLGLDAVGVGVGLVDLVDRDDDRHLRGAGVVDRLDRLGHHAVVGGDHDDRDVGDLGAAGAHRRERLVARACRGRRCAGRP